MKSSELTDILKKKELFSGEILEIRELKGGVSSEIYLVSDGETRIVVKKARKKLMVEDDWFAGTERNQIERKFSGYLDQAIPGTVPRILFGDDRHNFYVMEYLDESFMNWKKQLMDGNFEIRTAQHAAVLLANLQQYSQKDPGVRKIFSSADFFRTLRVEPYLLTTAERHPELSDYFFEEAKRLMNSKEVLVHGDFSPKNLMTRGNELKLLDHEVAHFGDSSFDLAFLMNHLFLKQLYHTRKIASLPDLAGIVWSEYQKMMHVEKGGAFDRRTGRLLLLLMMARVDGKSPVEYLDEGQQNFVREFVSFSLQTDNDQIDAIGKEWQKKIKQQYLEH